MANIKVITLAASLLITAATSSFVTLLITNKKKEVNPFSRLDGFSDQPHEIPIDKAKNMIRHYSESEQRTSKPADQIVTSVYFDFGALAKYMLKMITLSNATGTRVYFAKYDQSEPRTIDGRQNSINLKDYNTVVFVATKKVNGEIIDILRDKNKNLVPVLYQPFNGGISCPPYPPRICKGQALLELTNNPDYVPLY